MTAHKIKVSPVNELNEQPCALQAALMGLSPEALHAEVDMALEAEDSARLVSLLHHMAALDLKIAGKSPYLDLEKITEAVPNFLNGFHLERFDQEEAKAWGHFVGYWMANKQQPERHYWMMNFLHQYAEGLSEHLSCDQLVISALEGHHQLISTLCTHVEQSNRDHHLKPLTSAFIEDCKLSLAGSDVITHFIMGVNNQPLLDAFASDIFSLIDEGNIRPWICLTNLLCSEAVRQELFSAFSAASISHGLPAEGFLFDALKRCLDRGFATGSLAGKIQEVHDFMLKNKDRIKPLADHLLTEDNLKTFKQTLNLDLSYFFKPEDLPSSARRLVLESELGM